MQTTPGTTGTTSTGTTTHHASRAGAVTPTPTRPRPAVAAAAVVAALALSGTGPPAVAVYAAADAGHATPAPSTTGPTTWDPESLLAARHRQMDASWRVGPVTDQAASRVTAEVTALRRSSLVWVF